MSDLRLMSLCSGYGGLDLAVEDFFGATTRFVAEVDVDASTVLASRFPMAANLGDIKCVDWWQFAGRVDILTAGYPCQPFSQAGLRRGTEDERHLWPWIAEAVRQIRPRVVVLENVAGHLRRGFGVVLADFAEMGMSARWCTVRASEVGAPHRRERVFAIAYADSDRLQGIAQGNRSVCKLGIEQWGHFDGCGLDAATDPNRQSARRFAGSTLGQEGQDSGRGQSHNGQRPEDGVRIVDSGQSGFDWGQYAFAVSEWERRIGRPAPLPLVPGSRQLNAKLVEWMMGLPAGWVTDLIPNRRSLRILGNGVVPQQAAFALGRMT